MRFGSRSYRNYLLPHVMHVVTLQALLTFLVSWLTIDRILAYYWPDLDLLLTVVTLQALLAFLNNDKKRCI